jgi:hypothetical protein
MRPIEIVGDVRYSNDIDVIEERKEMKEMDEMNRDVMKANPEKKGKRRNSGATTLTPSAYMTPKM